MKEADLIELLKKEGYFNIRVIDDGIVCCIRMIFTVAVIIEPNEYGYERRYCYKTLEEAVACCDSMKSVDDAPLPGYTAIK